MASSKYSSMIELTNVIGMLKEESRRSLIMVDGMDYYSFSWMLIDVPYNIQKTIISNTQFDILSNISSNGDRNRVYSTTNIPFLCNIGSWKSTMIIRYNLNDIVCSNIEGASRESLLGLE